MRRTVLLLSLLVIIALCLRLAASRGLLSLPVAGAPAAAGTTLARTAYSQPSSSIWTGDPAATQTGPGQPLNAVAIAGLVLFSAWVAGVMLWAVHARELLQPCEACADEAAGRRPVALRRR